MLLFAQCSCLLELKISEEEEKMVTSPGWRQDQSLSASSLASPRQIVQSCSKKRHIINCNFKLSNYSKLFKERQKVLVAIPQREEIPPKWHISISLSVVIHYCSHHHLASVWMSLYPCWQRSPGKCLNVGYECHFIPVDKGHLVRCDNAPTEFGELSSESHCFRVVQDVLHK